MSASRQSRGLVTHPRRLALVVLPVSLLVSLACASLTGRSATNTPQSPTAPPATVATDDAALPALTPAQTEAAPEDSPAVEALTAEGDVPLGPGAFDFPEPAAGLNGLSSYKATLSLSFVGLEAGQPSQWSRTYVMLSTLEPLARQLTIASAGQLPDLELVLMAELDGAAYERRGDKPCTARVIEPGQALAEQMEPAGFLTGVLGVNEAGNETVNGMAANHYTFDERALGELGLAQSTGELWVAVEGGYLLRYRLSTTGGPDYFGEGSEGTVIWDYELAEVNQPHAITLPGDCPAGMLDAPLLPDASDVVNEPGLVSYLSAASLAEAAAYYQAQLPALGWQPSGEALLADNLAVQDFVRANRRLSMLITVDETGTIILLTVEPIAP